MVTRRWSQSTVRNASFKLNTKSTQRLSMKSDNTVNWGMLLIKTSFKSKCKGSCEVPSPDKHSNIGNRGAPTVRRICTGAGAVSRYRTSNQNIVQSSLMFNRKQLCKTRARWPLNI
jgi:hypothetical protein